MGRWPGRGHRWDAAWPSGEVTSADSSPFLILCGGQGTIPPTPKRSFWDKTKQDSIIVQWKEETVSVFNLQTSAAGYSGTSLVFTFYVVDTCGP